MVMNILEFNNKIAKVFSLIPHPKPDRINPYPCCTDHDIMTDWYREHTWQEFQKLLEEDTLDPEFMPTYPDAYIYFLPAVLRYTLESYEIKKDNIWEWVSNGKITCRPIADWIKVLVPLFEEPYLTDIKDICKILEPEQIKVISDYLSFFLEVSPIEQEQFRKDIRRALNEVWLEYKFR
jgi:hypothetical protein